MPPQLTLYNLRGCPFCIRVKRHLARLNLEYEEIQVPRLRFRRKEVKRISGQNQVPVIVDGDHVISDSHVICEYLTDHYGKAAQASVNTVRTAESA